MGSAEKSIIHNMYTGINRVNRNYTFGNYIVKKNNMLAREAALSVAENACESVNPLFISGEKRTGKTHLLFAIANRISDSRPYIKVQYTTWKTFANEVRDSMKYSMPPLSELHSIYSDVDVLLIDDFQCISKQDEIIQKEFFSLLDTRIITNKKIIIASDEGINDINGLYSEIKSRIMGGLTVTIADFDRDDKMAILQDILKKQDSELQEEILDYIAVSAEGRVADLQEMLDSVISLKACYGDKMNLDIVKGFISAKFGIDMYMEKPDETSEKEDIPESLYDKYHVLINQYDALCSLCRRFKTDQPIVISPFGVICDECAEVCNNMLSKWKEQEC